MTYQLEIAFHPGNELIASLHTYLCKIWHKRIDMGPGGIEEIRERLSAPFEQKLSRTEMTPDWRLLFLLAYLSPCRESAGHFLRWMKELSLGDLYVILSPYVHSFPADLQTLRDQFYELLSEWNSQYFQSIDNGILQSLEEDAARNRLLTDRLPADVLAEQMTNGIYFEPADGLNRLVLIPQHHFVPGNVFYSFGSMTLCQYPANSGAHSHEEGPSPRLYRMLRSLSEKSRLRILRFLRKEPHSFIEVVRYLGISKGITHEHLFSLRCAGLVRAHVAGETVTGYSLRMSAVDELQQLLKAYLEDEPERSESFGRSAPRERKEDKK